METLFYADNPHATHNKLAKLYQSVTKKVIGQKLLIQNLLVCLLADGHILIEGMPGLAKTTAAKAISAGLESKFHRIQFTPDLLPSDLLGTEIYIHDKNSFSFRKGPLFSNIILADEINRAPAKVQSALLESMEEKQITVGHSTYKLPEIFMVLATQNPIEQEGTYQLPEAQMDRFLMHATVDFPSHDEELQVIELNEKQLLNSEASAGPLTTQQEIISARQSVLKVHISESLKNYVVSLVSATRWPQQYNEHLSKWISYGASPRATLGIIRCAKALAWLYNSEYVTPHHIQTVCIPVLRHRIIPTFESEAEGITRDQIIEKIIDVVAVP